MFKVPEKYRIKVSALGSDESFGNNGAFLIPLEKPTDKNSLFVCIYAFVIASNGEGWEHCSVSLTTKKGTINRTPTWDEMCKVKDLFWGKEDTVIQYHPAESDYVNMHKYCLHLWRPIGIELPKPHHSLIGIK